MMEPEWMRMKEEDWQVCDSPELMLRFLGDCLYPEPSDRKWRLFSVACQRRTCHLIDEDIQKIIDVAERFADGQATPSELEAAHRFCKEEGGGLEGLASLTESYDPDEPEALPRYLAQDVAHDAYEYIGERAQGEAEEKGLPTSGVWETASAAERILQANLVRDVFGNPFRPVALDPVCHTPTVLTLAQAAYDSRTLPAGTLEPDRLAVLADALEENGCTDAELLGHLRGPGPHYRGCWAVDILLDKS